MADMNITEEVYYSGGICHLDTTASSYSYSIVLIFVAIVSTLENLVVLVAIFNYEVLRTPSILLLGFLALIDFFTGAVITPIKVVITLEERLLSFGVQFLHGFMFAFWSSVFLSLSTVLLISIDRFLNVFFLHRYTLTKRMLAGGLLLSWICPFIIILCWALQIHDQAINWFALLYFIFCIVGMLSAYIGMIVILRKHMMSMDNDHEYLESQKKAVKTTFIIIVVCILLNGPPIAFIILEEFLFTMSDALCAVSFFTLCANPLVNPWVYCSRIPVMKKHILKLVRYQRFVDNNGEESEIALCEVGEVTGV